MSIPIVKLTLPSMWSLLTPLCRVLPEQLTGLQLVKKFPAFHGTRRFITALTSVRHLSLSWASPIQSTCPHPISWRSTLILSTHNNLPPTSAMLRMGTINTLTFFLYVYTHVVGWALPLISLKGISSYSFSDFLLQFEIFRVLLINYRVLLLYIGLHFQRPSF